MDDQLRCELTRSYPKAPVHIRSQYSRRRFGLVFGSGARKDSHTPDRPGLLERIAKHGDVHGLELLPSGRESTTTTAELLRRHFDARMEKVLRSRN